jgi:hypothetical protein
MSQPGPPSPDSAAEADTNSADTNSANEQTGEGTGPPPTPALWTPAAAVQVDATEGAAAAAAPPTADDERPASTDGAARASIGQHQRRASETLGSMLWSDTAFEVTPSGHVAPSASDLPVVQCSGKLLCVPDERVQTRTTPWAGVKATGTYSDKDRTILYTHTYGAVLCGDTLELFKGDKSRHRFQLAPHQKPELRRVSGRTKTPHFELAKVIDVKVVLPTGKRGRKDEFRVLRITPLSFEVEPNGEPVDQTDPLLDGLLESTLPRFDVANWERHLLVASFLAHAPYAIDHLKPMPLAALMRPKHEFELGRGAFGAVYRVKKDREPIAVKQLLHFDANAMLVNIFAEAIMLSELKHKNIAGLVGCTWDPGDTDAEMTVRGNREPGALIRFFGPRYYYIGME